MTFFKVSGSVAVVLVACGIAAVGNAQAMNLITNGDFATNTFAGWTVSGATPSAAMGYADLHQDNNLAATVAELIDQTVALTAGTNYTLSFDYSGFSMGAPTIAGAWSLFRVGPLPAPGAATLNDLMENLPAANSAPSFINFTTAITPVQTGTYRLRFHGNNGNRYLYVDNVSLMATPVPEASTAGLLLAGLGALGWMVARRRQYV